MRRISSGGLLLAALAWGLVPARLCSQAEGVASRALELDDQAVPAGAQAVDIVLDEKGFTPIDLYRNGGDMAPITWRGCKAADIMSKLKKTKPDFITREPAYRGSRQLYGHLTLGSRKNRRHYFVLDVTAPDDMVMYFDFNNSGRLDDNPPLKNMGSFKKGENGLRTAT